MISINELIIGKLDQGGQDIKTLNFVFNCLANIAPSNLDIVNKILRETCILQALKFLLDNPRVWHIEVLDNIYRLLEHLIKVPLEASQINDCFRIASIGLLGKTEKCKEMSLKLLATLIMKYPELINKIGQPLFSASINLMKS